MRTVDPRRAIRRRSWSRLTDTVFVVALLAFGFGLLPHTPPIVSAHADEVSSNLVKDSCLDGLPTPKLEHGLHRVVQLVNCSNATVVGTANAAQQKDGQPLPVMPREGTWLMGPAGSANNGNVLTIDIPIQWEDTKCPQGEKNCKGIVGPRFWARTGCRYDLAFDKAQCETGGCGGRYDCSAARLAASVGTTA